MKSSLTKTPLVAVATILLLLCCSQLPTVSARCENLEFEFYTDSDCADESRREETDTDFKNFITEILDSPELENPNLSECYEKNDPNIADAKHWFKVSELIHIFVNRVDATIK